MPRAALLLLLAALMLAPSCGSPGSSPASGEPQTAALEPELPAPSQMLDSVKGSSAVVLSRDGADFDVALPNRGVTASGSNGLFTPTNFQAQPPEFSYAIYSFNVEGAVVGELTVASGLSLDTSPYIGAADFAADRWDWQAFAGGQNIAEQHIAADGTVLLAVVTFEGVLGYELQRLSFAAYDELEDNDTPETANPLPGANFSSFRGNCGNYDDFPGYDGDGEDWFSLTDTFEADVPLDLSVTFQTGNFGVAEGKVFLEVYSASGALLETGSSGVYQTNVGMVYGTDFTDSDLPLKLRVYCDPEERFEGGNYRIFSRSGFAPTAVLDVPKFEENVPATLTLDASASTDPDGDIVEYEWSYEGPGDIEADDIVTLVPQLEVEWSVPGAYTVYVTARDATNYTSSDSDVILLGPNPFDEIEPNDEGQPLDPLKSGGWKGNTGRDDTVAVIYDGSDDRFQIPVAAGESARFAVETTAGSGVFVQGLDYFAPGKTSGFTLYWDRAYQLKNNSGGETAFFVEVGEGFSGHEGGDYTLRWYTGIEPGQPTIVPSVDSGPAPLTVDFTLDDLSDADGTVETFQWDFNSDGTVDATTMSPSFTFTEPGNHNVRVIIYDDDQLRNSDAQTISVQ